MKLELTAGEFTALRTMIRREMDHIEDLKENHQDAIDRSQADWNRRVESLWKKCAISKQ